MAPGKKAQQYLTANQKQLAFRLGKYFNRLEWFFRWALHTRTEHDGLDAVPALETIMNQLIPSYTSNQQGNIVSYIQKLSKSILKRCNANYESAHCSVHGYEEAVRLFNEPDPAKRDAEAISKVRFKIDKLFRSTFNSIRRIHRVLRDDAKKLQLNDQALQVHQDFFDLGQLLDQLAFPPLDESQFNYLIKKWCKWKYFYLFLHQPPTGADRVDFFEAMQLLNREVLMNQLNRLELQQVNTQPIINRDLVQRNSINSFPLLDLRMDLRVLQGRDDSRQILVKRIQALVIKLTLNTNIESLAKELADIRNVEQRLVEICHEIEQTIQDQDNSADTVSKRKSKPKHLARNMWIYEQCKDTAQTYKKICSKLMSIAVKKDWEPLGSGNVLYGTVTRFAKREGLEPLPKRYKS